MKYFSVGTISKNLAFLVIVAVLPALGILLFTGIEQRRASIEEATDNIILLTNSMAQVQQDLTRSSQQLLTIMALQPEIQSLDIEASRKIFAAALEKSPVFHNIALVDLNGDVLSTGSVFREVNLSDRPHFQQALATKSFAAGSYVVTRLGEVARAMPFAYPVLDESGEPKAVLTTVIDLDRFTRFHEGAKVSPDTFISATDNNGVRLFYFPHRQTNPVGKKIKSDVWEKVRNAKQAEIFTSKGSDGKKRIICFQPLRLAPDAEPYMYVWAGTTEEAILGPANAALIRNLLLMLCASALALLIAAVLAKDRLIAPIQQLLQMTQDFAAGELESRSGLVEQKNEFGTLAQAFHDMAVAIKSGQEALRQNEARFRTVMNSMNALVYVADMASYQLLFLNEYGKKIFGEVGDKLCWEHLQKGQTGPCPFCTNKYLLDNQGQPGEIYTWEFQNTLTGNWYYIHDQAIEWIDGRIVRMEIATDITDRKQAEAKLAEETKRLETTLESIGDGVISCDTEGRVVLINQVAEQLTGWNGTEAIGQPLGNVLTIVNEQTGEAIADSIERVLATGKTMEYSHHTLLIDKNGLKKNIFDSTAPIKNAQGKIIGVVLVIRDITERLRTEEELMKVKKLESIGVLAGGIAHDFNNILAAILGSLDLSLRDTGIGKSTRQRLKQAQTASFRARDLTQQLLTFAKGGQPIKETSSLEDVVRESAEFVLSGDKVACKYRFPGDLYLVDIDKGQFSQVIQNIIINASNAMPDGGLIEIEAQNIAAAEADNLLQTGSDFIVKLTIKDTGVGIPTELLDKIFDPYFTTKQKGSGLGLAITHSIISKHGGAITAHSTPGAGSLFTIYLPASQATNAPQKKPTGTTANAEKIRILVVDDEEIVRQIAAEMLKELGHEVLFASDGGEAIALYRDALTSDKPIDLLLMDLTIPGGIGGKEALEQILAIDKKARAIVSSGYSNAPVMANYEKYGFVAAIAKPYQLNDLAQAINQAIN